MSSPLTRHRPTKRVFARRPRPGAARAAASDVGRRLAAGVALGALLAGVTTVAVTAPATAAPIVQTPTCPAPDSMPTITTLGQAGAIFTDNNVNIFTAGNYTSTNVESEGLLVVMGDATVGRLNIGAAGGGSFVVPTDKSVMLAVGGDMHAPQGALIGVGLAPAITGGSVQIGGSLTGSLDPGSGNVTRELGSAAVAQWAGLSAAMTAESRALFELADTGSYEATGPISWGYLKITAGAESSGRHVVTIPSSALQAGNDTTGVYFTDLATSGAPLVINVVDDTNGVLNFPAHNSYAGAGMEMLANNTPNIGNIASRVLWNLDDSFTSVTIGAPNSGGMQMIGSWLSPGLAHVTLNSSTNGRVWVNGDLTSQGGGNEQHSYPWNYATSALRCKAGRGEPVEPVTGAFSVAKVVTGTAQDLVPSATAFTIGYTVDGVAATPLTVLANGTPVTVTGLPAGAKVVFAEASPDAISGMTWDAPVITVGGTALNATTPLVITADRTAVVTVTNTATKDTDPGPGNGGPGDGTDDPGNGDPGDGTDEIGRAHV